MSETTVKKHEDGKTIILERRIQASQIQVWDAWTMPEIYEKWWGPKGMQTKVQTCNFVDGGHLLYKMTSSDGSHTMWVKSVYSNIDKPNSFIYTDYQSDENGGENPMMPPIRNEVRLVEVNGITELSHITYCDTPEFLEQMLGWGAFEAYKQAFDSLEEIVK